jgi:hypothetical protein
MRVRATIFAGLAIAMFVAAVPSDKAVIVNSGSTNSYGYTITVSSDGNGSVTLQDRGGASASAPKTFTVPAATTARFFADLAAARKGNATTVPCMKSASFGSSMHITWQGWVSPDLTCPPKDALGDALVTDVGAIRKAAGISESPLRSSPPLAEPT